MTLYLETSALLAWVLGEPAGARVRNVLAHADLVTTSALTVVEAERVFVRLVATRIMSEVDAADCRSVLASVVPGWTIIGLDSAILDRARKPFPEEPVRTLDALHLVSALVARAAVPGLSVLSLDARVRTNAAALGFPVVP
ncbi:MAG: type II toxin-antitoxin system VapC family toxin [Acidobacteriota bacterium]